MSAAIDTTSEVEILESLDFEPEHVCEWGPEHGPKHGVAAQWLLTLACCGISAAFCEGHALVVKINLEIAEVRGFALQCAGCGAESPARSWVPLKGGAS